MAELISGNVVITPGKQFGPNERVTLAKLNQLGKPTARVGEGAIGVRELSASAVRSIVPSVNRNVIINGNFDVWARGGWTNPVGLPTLLGNGSGAAFGADHWYLGTPSGAGVRGISRADFDLDQTAVPNSPTYYLRWGQDSPAGDPPTLSQPIEDVRTMAGKTVTVSWWMKPEIDAAGGVVCRLRQSFGGGSPVVRIITALSGGTISLSSGTQPWTLYEAHFHIPSLAGYTIGGDDSFLALEFIMSSTNDWDGWFLNFAQVQMEESAVRTAYETHSYAYEASRCQRYFEYSGGVLATSVAVSQPCFYFATRKYRTPDVALLAGYAGTGGVIEPILEVGYKQTVAHSVVAAFFMKADADIYQ